jgi:hypothetical protein
MMNFLITIAAWLVARRAEPSTYQGLSVLAGLAGKVFAGDAVLGQQILEAGMGIAAAIQTVKKEPLEGRDY